VEALRTISGRFWSNLRLSREASKRKVAPVQVQKENDRRMQHKKTRSCGLPAFQYRTQYSQSDVRSERAHGQINSLSSSYLHDEVQEDDIPSDTLMAIQSLVRSDQGLHVPITNNGSVQVILENQIYSIFDENHSSAVNSEILELIHNNKIERICCHDMSSTAFMLTDHYVRAVWDAHANQDHSCQSKFSDKIVSWFLSNLRYWTKATITESNLEDRWETSTTDNLAAITGLNVKDAVQYLLTAQFLIRDSKQNLSSGFNEESYFLWLPNWGIVLKRWNEGRRQLLTLLAQRKEMSKANVLQKNRHSHVSTDFLLNELLYKEKIRIVDRPFGSFVQLVKDDDAS